MPLFDNYSTTTISLTVAFVLLFAWFIFASIYLFKKQKNPYLHKAIPSVFTTLGILGTFIGIVAGLINFDAQDIAGSLPELLDGLRFSFLSSIAGIVAAFIFSRIIEVQLRKQEQAEEKGNKTLIVSSPDELQALNYIADLLGKQNALLNEKFDTKIQLLINQNGILTEKLSASIVESTAQNELLKVKLPEIIRLNSTQNTELQELKNNSQKQLDAFNLLNTNLGNQFDNLTNTLNTNQAAIVEKLETFAQELQKNNTEALVDVMRQATEDFNRQMSEIINQLVKENFEMLNQSVANLVGWQKDNKTQMEQLVKDYKTVSAHFTNTAQQTENIATASKRITEETKKATQELRNMTTQTKTLVAEDGKLQTIVTELNKVMVNDKTFTKISNNLKTSSQEMVSANKGVVQMIKWQEDYKTQMAQLVEDYKTVSAHFESTAEQTKNIANETEKITNLTAELVAKEGKLQGLVTALNKAIVDDNQFSELAKSLKDNSTILLSSNTKTVESLDKLTIYLNDNKHLNENTKILIQTIKDFKNTNSDYWTAIREELKKSMGTISQSIGKRDQQYEKWLTDTLSNLDNVMERYMRGN